jgi:glycolate oxidase FAD binding subunit
MAAANLSGPRRIKAGACRDAFLGVRLVNGKGEIVKAGGRVLKNVTGLDLTRLMAGAFGTLGFMTELTFKVLPRPQTSATLMLRGLADRRAIEALSAGLGSPFEVAGAAHLPAGIGEDKARTLLRLEGFVEAVAYRTQALAEALMPFGTAEILDAAASTPLWRAVRDASFLAAPRDSALWRVSVAPSRGPAVTEAVAKEIEARFLYDWGGGLVWLASPATGDAGAAVVHAAAAAARGHATLVRAPEALRATVEVFQPQPDAVMCLTRAVKASFDPAGVLEPGRMYAGV